MPTEMDTEVALHKRLEESQQFVRREMPPACPAATRVGEGAGSWGVVCGITRSLVTAKLDPGALGRWCCCPASEPHGGYTECVVWQDSRTRDDEGRPQVLEQKGSELTDARDAVRERLRDAEERINFQLAQQGKDPIQLIRRKPVPILAGPGLKVQD